jgi:hypothetical protein
MVLHFFISNDFGAVTFCIFKKGKTVFGNRKQFTPRDRVKFLEAGRVTFDNNPVLYSTMMLRWAVDKIQEAIPKYLRRGLVIGDKNNPDILDKLIDDETNKTIDELW